MKIIASDNFDREIYDDILIAENITNMEAGQVMVDALNYKYCNHDNAAWFYRLVPDDHKLFVFEP